MSTYKTGPAIGSLGRRARGPWVRSATMLAGLLCIAWSSARADTLTLKDGRVFEGTQTAKRDHFVWFSYLEMGLRVERPFAEEDIADLKVDALLKEPQRLAANQTSSPAASPTVPAPNVSISLHAADPVLADPEKAQAVRERYLTALREEVHRISLLTDPSHNFPTINTTGRRRQPAQRTARPLTPEERAALNARRERLVQQINELK